MQLVPMNMDTFFHIRDTMDTDKNRYTQVLWLDLGLHVHYAVRV